MTHLGGRKVLFIGVARVTRLLAAIAVLTVFLPEPLTIQLPSADAEPGSPTRPISPVDWIIPEPWLNPVDSQPSGKRSQGSVAGEHRSYADRISETLGNFGIDVGLVASGETGYMHELGKADITLGITGTETVGSKAESLSMPPTPINSPDLTPREKSTYAEVLHLLQSNERCVFTPVLCILVAARLGDLSTIEDIFDTNLGFLSDNGLASKLFQETLAVDSPWFRSESESERIEFLLDVLTERLLQTTSSNNEASVIRQLVEVVTEGLGSGQISPTNSTVY